MPRYQACAQEALDAVLNAISCAEALLPPLLRQRHWQETRAGGLNAWLRVAAWYLTQPDYRRDIADVVSDLVLLSRAKANLTTAVRGEPVHEPDITLPKTRRPQ